MRSAAGRSNSPVKISARSSAGVRAVTTTRTGQLLRVQMAPVRATQGLSLNGYVLMLDNITRELADESARDQLLHGLTEGSRSSLANLQAALDMLEFPDLEPAMRERFFGVIREETGAMSQRIQNLVATSTKLI